MSTARPKVAKVEYNPETGALTKTLTNGTVRNTYGSKGGHGYLYTRFQDKMVQVHRLAVYLMTGEWPEHDVDHINGARDDNRWCNLRNADRSTNCENQRAGHSGSTSPLLGVSWNRVRGLWVAQIKIRGEKNRYLGAYSTPEEAHTAYLTAKRDLHAGCTI